MMRAFSVLVFLAGFFGSVQLANADIISTFDLTWSGASFGNGATATGEITLDVSNIENPGTTVGVTTQNANSFVTDFSITIKGANAGNGTFGFADYNGSTVYAGPIGSPSGGFYMQTGGGTLDFTTQLIGQSTSFGTWGPNNNGDFNIFINGKDSSAPTGFNYFLIETNGAREGGELLLLTSFQPAAAAPAPSGMTLCGSALLTGLGFLAVRRRKLVLA